MFRVEKGKGIFRIVVNEYEPVVDFKFEKESESSLTELPERLEIRENLILKELSIDEHILGMGEKAYPIDRRRTVLTNWNTDSYGYSWYTDPLYVSIPFFISISKGKATGYFLNYPGKSVFDFGVRFYDKIAIEVYSPSYELFVFDGKSVEEVIEKYTRLTGYPFLLPEWALGYQISRFSYYPQQRVIELLEKHNVKIDSIYLDIDYMENYKMFTWDKEKFNDPKGLIDSIHNLGARVVTILDPAIRVDQNYEVFRRGLGSYVETDSGAIFVGDMWSGPSCWVDFLSENARSWWKEEVRKWLKLGIDGLWIDMNEPAVFKISTLPENATHRINGRKVRHNEAHNSYAYFEAMATYEAMEEEGLEPFVLSRAGYAGIQKYAAIWSGDERESYSDLKLQIPIMLGLSISGVPYVGFDIGGFVSREKGTEEDPLLKVRFYQVALFLPIFRAHKSKRGEDNEIFTIPSKYRKLIEDTIKLRRSFIPYINALVLESHQTGHPIIRPLPYHFPNDEDAYQINDEMMIGSGILYAPHTLPQDERDVYLPRDEWVNFWNWEKCHHGWITSSEHFPIYIRNNSVIPLNENGLNLYIMGEGVIKLRDGNVIERRGSSVILSKKTRVNEIILLDEKRKIKIDREVERFDV
ncbi:alpha-glucosidase [Sulfolobales archaeon HS-7]|nr:alpha-glucosidase [Sulfolobales archaeon HS-7]